MDKKYLIFVIIISLVFLCFCQYTNIKNKKLTESFTATNQINIDDNDKQLLKKFIEQDINDITPGIIVAIHTDDIPSGWVLCNGVNEWIDSNGEKHTTPNLSGRFLLGAGQGEQLTNRILNSKGGEEEHQLLISELPPHKHTGKTGIYDEITKEYTNDGKHEHTYKRATNKAGVACVYNNDEWFYSKEEEKGVSGSGHHQHVFVTDITGKNEKFNIMPPYYTVNYIIKTKE